MGNSKMREPGKMVKFPVAVLLLFFFVFSFAAQGTAAEKKAAVVLMPIQIGKGIPPEYRQGYESAIKQSLSIKWRVYAGEMVKKAVEKIYRQRSAEAKAGKECDETKCLQDVAIAFQTELVAVATVVKGESGYMLSLSVTNVLDDKDVYSNTIPCEDCNELAIVDKLKDLYAAPQVAAKTPAAASGGNAPAGMVYVKQGSGGFYMDTTEVTQDAYQRVIGSDPSYFTGCPTCPVEMVDWDEATAYCKKVGKRLPTEQEWEYAATSGGKGETYAGTSNESELGDYAWYEKNSGDKTHPVGKKKPNGLGLYDMSGNVWEWTDSWYDDSKEYRVLRGGSWFLYADYLRTAYQHVDTPLHRYDFIGFRCAQSP